MAHPNSTVPSIKTPLNSIIMKHSLRNLRTSSASTMKFIKIDQIISIVSMFKNFHPIEGSRTDYLTLEKRIMIIY